MRGLCRTPEGTNGEEREVKSERKRRTFKPPKGVFFPPTEKLRTYRRVKRSTVGNRHCWVVSLKKGRADLSKN